MLSLIHTYLLYCYPSINIIIFLSFIPDNYYINYDQFYVVNTVLQRIVELLSCIIHGFKGILSQVLATACFRMSKYLVVAISPFRVTVIRLKSGEESGI